MNEEKLFRVLVRSEMYIEVFAEDAAEAEDIANEKLWEDSKDFVRNAHLINTEEVEE